jgi:hypothetical protein
MEKKKGTLFQADGAARNKRAFRSGLIDLLYDEDECKHHNEEDDTQNDRQTKQSPLHTATSRINTARVSATQPAQACALALQDHTQDEQDRDYNQRDI